MKYFYSVLLTFLFSFNAVAALNSSEQKVADLLLSGDVRQLKVAAKRIFERNISNPELIDIVAEILLKKYPHAYPSEADTMAWMSKAIGSTQNGRYHSVLSEIAESTTNKKLIKHTKKALTNLGSVDGQQQYLQGSYPLPDNLYAKETAVARDKRIMDLLMAGDLKSLQQGARAIIDTKAQSTLLTDTVAEILVSYHEDASNDKIQTFAWMVKALGHSTSNRYAYVLTEVKDKGAHKKLRKYAKRALRAHGAAKGEQYQKGMLNKKIGNYDF